VEGKMVKVICAGEYFLTYVVPLRCEGKLRMTWDRSKHVDLYIYSCSTAAQRRP